jgi:phospholipid/cholesterol/gamma-HCH transport system ATP-binding protein
MKDENTPDRRRSSGEPILVAEDVVVSFGRVDVLRGVSFSVKRGETLCILGGSGGGKSTLLKAMIGEVRPSSGHIRIDGRDLCALDARGLDEVRRRLLGVMFQSGALLNSLTVAENVALPLSYHTRLDAETIDTMVKIKLHQVDLLHAADRRPSEISGGMLKRAAIARALAMDPPLLFYDEPSAGLDPIATSRIDQLINSLRDSMGMTNVVVTHVLESVERIADHVVMLDRGEVILDGTYEDLLASEDPRVVQFRSGDLAGPAQGQTSTHDYLRDLLI